MDTTRYAPTFSGPKFKLYTPVGLVALLARSLWRYFITGKELRGAGDNATLLSDATVDYRGRPVEKLTRARWQRLARRWAVVGVPVLLYLLAPAWAFEMYVSAGVFIAGGWIGYASGTWLAMRERVREFMWPTWAVVAKVIGERPRRRDAQRVALPKGFGTEEVGDEEVVVRIHLPLVPLDEGVKKRVVASAGERLGIREPVAAWTVKGAVCFVDIMPMARPPHSLTFSSIKDFWLDASATRPLVGVGSKGRKVYADLDNDGPHVGASGGTGTGKSTLMRIILAKRVREGAGLIACDYKVNSHPWARRIAAEDPTRVRYFTEEEEISEAVLAVYAEFQRRRAVLKDSPAALETFRDVDLLVEELNSLATKLRRWWGHERRRIIAEYKEAGETPPYVPTVPPAVDALAELVQMGRELKVRVHFAAQRLDASALSPKDGGAVRESITNRFLAKYTKQTWSMLCGGVPFESFPGGPRGIWTAVVNGEVTHFRVPLMSNDEAYALAMGGPAPAGPILGGARLVQPFKRAVERAVTLAEALPHLPHFKTLDGLRTAVKRARERGELEPVGKRGKADVFDLAVLTAMWGERATLEVTQ